MATERIRSDRMTSVEQVRGSSAGYECGRGGEAEVFRRGSSAGYECGRGGEAEVFRLSCVSLHSVLCLLCLLPEDEAILRRSLGSTQVRTETVDMSLGIFCSITLSCDACYCVCVSKWLS